MKRISRIVLSGAFTVILLAAACAPAGEGASNLPSALAQGDLTGSPTAIATDTAGTAEATTATAGTSEATATNTTLTPSIPVTGPGVITLDCQYCVDTVAHAQLLIPRNSTIHVISPPELASTSGNNNGDNENGDNDGEDNDGNGNGDNDDNGDRMGCSVIDRFRDTKLVLCRAEQNTTITLNVCQDDNNCTEVQLTLQSCTLGTGTPPPFATATQTTTATATLTLVPSTATGTATSTPLPPGTETPTPTDTPTGSATSTSTATSTATSTPTP